MAFDCNHTIHKAKHHFGWNNANAPVLTVAPGDSVEFETVDSSGGQLNKDSTVAAVGSLDFGKVNPVTGPVYIDGAEPGDAVKVKILGLAPSGWGWTANIPGFGLLADQFTEPALNIWRYDTATMSPSAYGPGGQVPLKPFCGTIGLAPAEAGTLSIVPPRRVGGNMDIRDIAEGTELWLPVEVAGGLFSLGDTHAAQGDGEVCGTAIESPMSVALHFELEKGAKLEFPRFRTLRSGDPPFRCQGLRRDDRHRPRPDAGGAGRGDEHDRLAEPHSRHVGRRGLHAVQRRGRLADQRDRRSAELGGVVLLPPRRLRIGCFTCNIICC
jgi:acetamidase/formamidase